MPKAHINDVDLHYEVSGIGPSIALCHGYTSSSHDWSFQIPALSQNYQVITMDHRGHGNSSAPSHANAYSIPIFANDIYQLLNYLGTTKCCLVGHSMGGFIALQFAIDYPQLITSLVLVGTSSSWINLPGYAELRTKLDEIARRDGMEAAFEYDTRHNPLLRRHFEKHPELREIAKRRICRTSVDGFTHAGQALLLWPSVTSRLGEISAPTLVILGEEDTAFRQPSKDLAKGIPNSELKLVPQASHSPQEERPTTFNRLLTEFLSKVEAG